MARCLPFVLYPGVSRHQTVSNRLFCNNSQYGVEYLIRPDFQALGVLAWFYPNVWAVIFFCCDFISISGCRLWEAPMLESGSDLRDGRKWIPGKKVSYDISYMYIIYVYHMTYITYRPKIRCVLMWFAGQRQRHPDPHLHHGHLPHHLHRDRRPWQGLILHLSSAKESFFSKVENLDFWNNNNKTPSQMDVALVVGLGWFGYLRVEWIIEHLTAAMPYCANLKTFEKTSLLLLCCVKRHNKICCKQILP